MGIVRDAILSELCIDALTTDGGHHKQWYLEQILKIIIDSKDYDILKKRHDWEKGIAP
jgi:hypothetical protein